MFIRTELSQAPGYINTSVKLLPRRGLIRLQDVINMDGSIVL